LIDFHVKFQKYLIATNSGSKTMIVVRLRVPQCSTLFEDAGAMKQDCVMGNSEAIVAVKTAISICDISNGT